MTRTVGDGCHGNGFLSGGLTSSGMRKRNSHRKIGAWIREPKDQDGWKAYGPMVLAWKFMTDASCMCWELLGADACCLFRHLIFGDTRKENIVLSSLFLKGFIQRSIFFDMDVYWGMLSHLSTLLNSNFLVLFKASLTRCMWADSLPNVYGKFTHCPTCFSCTWADIFSMFSHCSMVNNKVVVLTRAAVPRQKNAHHVPFALFTRLEHYSVDNALNSMEFPMMFSHPMMSQDSSGLLPYRPSSLVFSMEKFFGLFPGINHGDICPPDNKALLFSRQGKVICFCCPPPDFKEK